MKLLIFLIFIISVSCTHTVKNRSVASENLGKDLPEDAHICQGVPLKLNEECDRPGEVEVYKELAERLQTNIQALVRENRKEHNGKNLRAFHAKKHGCMQGQLKVLSNEVVTSNLDRLAKTAKDKKLNIEHLNNINETLSAIRTGIFEMPNKSYPVWVRYSNASPFAIKADHAGGELRGMAVKVMGVSGIRANNFGETLSTEKYTQDLLMTNKPFGTTPGPRTFIKLGEYLAQGKEKFTMSDILSKAYAFKILGIKKSVRIAKISTKIPANPATESYWSGNAFYLGDKAIKFGVEPCSESLSSYPADYISAPDKKGTEVTNNPNYLRNRLAELSKRSDICFKLNVQFQTDVKTTSIEDGLDQWTEEESPSIHIANIILPKQIIRDDQQDQFCDQLKFNPWHSLEAHKPMSDSGQARFFVYKGSADGRSEGSHKEPLGNEFINNLITGQ